MSNEANRSKRMTFQGLINADKEKMPQRSSRSRSKSRTKASSISKSASGTSRSWKKTQTMKSVQNQKPQTGKTGNENIFREQKRSQEQEMMKKIIKLKNYSTRIENAFKDLSIMSNTSQISKKPQSQEESQCEQLQTYLQEFDVELRRKVKQVGDHYLKQLESEEKKIQDSQHAKVPQYQTLSLPHAPPGMPTLEAKLAQMEARWAK